MQAFNPMPYPTEAIQFERGFTLLKGKASASAGAGEGVKSHSDLIPGQYEGGYKLWECTADLVEAMRVEIQDGHLSFRGKDVLELGCGHGLPGILACLKGASTVHFQDFNDSVLINLTIPNVDANLRVASAGAAGLRPSLSLSTETLVPSKPAKAGPEDARHQLANRALPPGGSNSLGARPVTPKSPHPHLKTRYFAGDWADVSKLLSTAGADVGPMELPPSRLSIGSNAAGDAQDPSAKLPPASLLEGHHPDARAAAGSPRRTVRFNASNGASQRRSTSPAPESVPHDTSSTPPSSLQPIQAVGDTPTPLPPQSPPRGSGSGSGSPLAYHKVLEGSPAFSPKADRVSGEGKSEELRTQALSRQKGGYDVILTAETVYSVASLPKLLALVKKCLRKPYRVPYLSGKRYYFGVGGGTRQFCDLVKEDGELHAHLVKEIADGASNVREVWKFFYKP